MSEPEARYECGNPLAEAANPSPESARFPDLTPVIQWLEAGCDPLEAAKELRIYQDLMRAQRPK